MLAVGGGFEPPTVQLAAIQSLVVYPSRLECRHYIVFVLCSPPPRQEGMAAKFHHPTIIKNFTSVFT